MQMLPLYNITETTRAYGYLLKQLEMGTTLAARVRVAVDFRLGQMFVALPEGTDLTNLPKYEETGHIHWRERGFDTLAHLMKRFLATEEAAAVLLQDTLASPTEDWLRDYKYRDHVTSYLGEVYWHVAGSELEEDDISGLLSSASFHPFSAFFYVQGRLGESSVLSDTDLHWIVKTLVGVAVGVFDEESFLLWWSNRLPLPSGIGLA